MPRYNIAYRAAYKELASHRILAEHREKVAARVAEMLTELDEKSLALQVEASEGSGLVGDLMWLLWMVPVGRRRRAGADAVSAAARALLED